ncbi:MAG: flagellar M-ring protein FliF [Actinobacteria bacterium]|nr:flagellar M-ring protein FliF [Actinomycetota bacterium]
MSDIAPNVDAPQGGLGGLKRKASESFNAFSPTQRLMMGAAAAAVVVGVLALSVFAPKPEMTPLMTNLAATDAQAITTQLESLGITYELSAGGSTILVPADKVYQARIDIASVDMPSSGKVGYGILDNSDLTSSEFNQQVNYQRAMEGELAMTIEAMSGVSSATVHLALPKNNTFALDEQKATASVMVKTNGNGTLSSSQVQAIVNLVSGGIENLASADVTVADADGKVLAAPGGVISGGGGNGDNQETTATFEATLASSIENMLGSMVGKGKAKVTVAADLDFNSSKQISETFSAPATIAPGEALAINESVKSEQYSGTGAGANAEGVLGPEGSADATSLGGAGNGAYQLDERQVNNAVNKVVEETSKAPGAINRLSVAVVVDEAAVGPDQITEVQNLVSAAAGLSPERGDVVAVSRFALDDSETEAMQEAIEAREATKGADGTPLWMYIVGGVVALGVAASFFRSKRAKGSGPVELRLHELPPANDGMIVVDPELASPEPALAAVGARSTASGDRREALGDLIDNQPDEVAELLRSWLGDRRETPR